MPAWTTYLVPVFTRSWAKPGLKSSIKERMRNLVALIVAMIEVGLVWVMEWSWQLTLALGMDLQG